MKEEVAPSKALQSLRLSARWEARRLETREGRRERESPCTFNPSWKHDMPQKTKTFLREQSDIKNKRSRGLGCQ